MRSVASVSLSVCNALTFVNLDLETSYWHVGTSSGSLGRSYIEVIGPRSCSREQKGVFVLYIPFAGGLYLRLKSSALCCI